MSLRCEVCGSIMVRNRRKNMRHSVGVVYECKNENCPAIEKRFHYKQGYNSDKQLHYSQVVYDPILLKEWNKRREVTQINA